MYTYVKTETTKLGRREDMNTIKCIHYLHAYIYGGGNRMLHNRKKIESIVDMSRKTRPSLSQTRAGRVPYNYLSYSGSRNTSSVKISAV